MMPQANAAHLLVTQQQRKYQSDLAHWVSQVRRARRHDEAFRTAAHPPAPGHLLRGLSGMTQSDKNRAASQVEQILRSLIESETPGPQDLTLLMRLSQGHWPRIWQQLEQQRRANAQPKS